jgi:hypothetical protein
MKATTMNHTPQEEAGPPYLKVYRSRDEVLGFRGLIIWPWQRREKRLWNDNFRGTCNFWRYLSCINPFCSFGTKKTCNFWRYFEWYIILGMNEILYYLCLFSFEHFNIYWNFITFKKKLKVLI